MAAKTKKKSSETPLMKQYNAIKAKHPSALLLFRVGDFYETFGEDAVSAANVLGIVLTKRKNGAAATIDLAGFPHHSLDTYLPKLVRAGYRVAICDQLEDPKLTKSIVKRGVTELVTPGVSFNEQVLEHNRNNFLAAVHTEKNQAGIAFLDVSTGEFLVAQGSLEYIQKLMQGLTPSEVLHEKRKSKEFMNTFGEKYYTFRIDDWAFQEDFARETLQKHFETSSLKGFGVEKMDLGVIAAGVAIHYLSETQHDKISHISSISRIEEERYVWLDRFTIRNLELLFSPNDDAVTLLDVLDSTVSPMGSRMLKRWVVLPLKEYEPIRERLSVVEAFVQDRNLVSELREKIREIGDMERVISRVAAGRITPKEVLQLKRGLDALVPIKELCRASKSDELYTLSDQINPCAALSERIEKEITDDPPALVSKGNVIATGVSEELDELRQLAHSGRDYLDQICERETKRTGIPSLKIGFNNVFGYYLEVRNTHKDKVPDDWVRKQTLTQAERYITEELKEYEQKILGAEEKILILEAELFNRLVLDMQEYVTPVQHDARMVAKLDCLLSFAVNAMECEYVKPEVNDSKIIDIKSGRHPVIEQQLPPGEPYIANDVCLDPDGEQILMITGPNMSGKSALLRQTALIVLMAQMGSYVPAKAASIGLVDKIFTRVGASDNISSGESTFMVEMNETASILNNLSDRSLVLLDEIGRGTSTYDGISIAWAIAEYLHENPSAHAKTLFATHYHELNDMEKQFERVSNYNVSVKETGSRVIFTRKLKRGGSEHSFGIHVAKMAGMPKQVIQRANQVLGQLERSHSGDELTENSKKVKVDRSGEMQLSFFQLDDPVLEQIREEILNTDINTLTPVEALMKLNEIKKISGGE